MLELTDFEMPLLGIAAEIVESTLLVELVLLLLGIVTEDVELIMLLAGVGSGLTTVITIVGDGEIIETVEMTVGEAVVTVVVERPVRVSVSTFVCVCITVMPACNDDEAEAPDPPSTGTTEYVGRAARGARACACSYADKGKACTDRCFVASKPKAERCERVWKRIV